MYKITALTLILSISATLLAQKKSITTFVYHDKNKNEIFDANDNALPNILVSNMRQIQQTNKKGTAELTLEKQDIVFVIKPEGYQSPIKKNKNPDFYKICYQKPSDKSLKYKGVNQTNIPDTIFFPMHKEIAKESIQGHMIGDIQTPTYSHVKYFRQLIMPDLISSTADFGICLGDIADNNLDLYSDIEKALSTSNMPLYMVFGNHDVNYHAKDNDQRAETYRSHFGPDYYAFNYGKNHFIVLNNVNYFGWNKKEEKKGGYTGGFDQTQLAWLKQDLAWVDSTQRIVLLTHIPLLKDFSDSTQLVEFFDLFSDRNDLLAVAGHTHSNMNWDFNDETLWAHQGQFKGQAAGASCGAWWVSPTGPDCLPDATCNDGIPAGTFIYTFEENKYWRDFIAGANYSGQQLRISEPFLFVEQDSLSEKSIYVNVFDGDTHTQVSYQIDAGEQVTMKKVAEKDPFIARNQYRRQTYDGWTPWIFPSDHIWKASYPAKITPGMHKIKAKCTLANGKSYETSIVFEVK